MTTNQETKVMVIKADYLQKQIGKFTGFCPVDVLAEKGQSSIMFGMKCSNSNVNFYPSACRLSSTSMPVNHLLDQEIRTTLEELSGLLDQARKEGVV